MLRTHTCGELRKEDNGKSVNLAGWVDTIRAYGKLAFIDLRDRYGKIQVVVKGQGDKIKEISLESCIGISGKVQERKKGTENKEMDTGDVEILTSDIIIYNKSKPLPFEVGDKNVGEEVRAKSRFLDLRGKELQDNLILRSRLYKSIIDFMEGEGFLYIDTPILGKSTPEGARDYIVPSRVNGGNFYALPQSPQTFKQLLMVSGFDKYFQIARCFRDEDLRADRQPEFTQLDIEMSFIEENDIKEIMERLWKYVFKEVLGKDLKIPFKRISYSDSMKKYNRDNPDIRTDKEKKNNEFGFVWVEKFPMFEWNDEDKRFYATHHPFTSPEDGADFSDLKNMNAKAYDLVLNGSEIGGGSIRIHNSEIQSNVFKALGIDDGEAKEKFGFLLNALDFGGPPHGGIAFGLDRVSAIMTKAESIRDVIAFPKNKAARDVMLNAPSAVSSEQLKEASIKLDVKKI